MALGIQKVQNITYHIVPFKTYIHTGEGGERARKRERREEKEILWDKVNLKY
jgi:hypothetical protein